MSRKAIKAAIIVVLIYTVTFVFASGLLMRSVKSSAGAIIALLASTLIGILVAFLFASTVKGNKVLNKIAKHFVTAVVTASVIKKEIIFKSATAYVTLMAHDLFLNTTLFVLLFLSFFALGFVPVFLVIGDGRLYRIIRVLQKLKDLLRNGAKLFGRASSANRELTGGSGEMPFQSEMDISGNRDRLGLSEVPEENLDRFHYRKGGEMYVSGKCKDALDHFSKIKDRQGFGVALRKLEANCHYKLGSWEKGQELLSDYLGHQPNDKDVTGTQLLIFLRRFELSPSDEEKRNIISNARDFAHRMMDKGVLTEQNIRKIWSDLIPEHVNG